MISIGYASSGPLAQYVLTIGASPSPNASKAASQSASKSEEGRPSTSAATSPSLPMRPHYTFTHLRVTKQCFNVLSREFQFPETLKQFLVRAPLAWTEWSLVPPPLAQQIGRYLTSLLQQSFQQIRLDQSLEKIG